MLLHSDLAVLRVDVPFPDFHNTIEPALRANRVYADGTVCRLTAWGESTLRTSLTCKLYVNISSLSHRSRTKSDSNPTGTSCNERANHYNCDMQCCECSCKSSFAERSHLCWQYRSNKSRLGRMSWQYRLGSLLRQSTDWSLVIWILVWRSKSARRLHECALL